MPSNTRLQIYLTQAALSTTTTISESPFSLSTVDRRPCRTQSQVIRRPVLTSPIAADASNATPAPQLPPMQGRTAVGKSSAKGCTNAQSRPYSIPFNRGKNEIYPGAGRPKRCLISTAELSRAYPRTPIKVCNDAPCVRDEAIDDSCSHTASFDE